MSVIPAGSVQAVRRFNRLYTRQLGLLDAGLLGSRYSLTEVRVLFELAQRDRPTAVEIATDLGIDRGLLSRLLAKLLRAGLVSRTRHPDDRRRAPLQLTAKGRRVFAQLDRRADRQVRDLLTGLPAPERVALVWAAQAVGAEGATAPPGEAILRAPRPGEYGTVIHRHGVVYAEEYGWDERFEGLVAEIVGRFAQRHDPSREKFWIAEREGRFLGCVFVVANAPDVAQLRCLLVEPAARGLRLGRRLVDECVLFARAAGYRRMILWTNDVLVSARRIYEGAGFRLEKEERHHSFGKDLVGQTWELDLTNR